MSQAQPLGSGRIIARNTGIFAAEMGRELAMLDAERGRYYILNETAHAIWCRLDEPLDVAELCKRLQGDFAVDAVRCEQETVALLRELLDAGLVQAV